MQIFPFLVLCNFVQKHGFAFFASLCLNLGFVKDKHTGGGKTARNSSEIAILSLLFVLIQTIL